MSSSGLWLQCVLDIIFLRVNGESGVGYDVRAGFDALAVELFKGLLVPSES